jgi:carbamoyl-phosphate synthase large subunit
MQVVYNDEQLAHYMEVAVAASPEHPVLLDEFLEGAVEIDVDAICDGETCVIGGIMEHIEEAGIHSGDSACVLPPFSLAEEEQAELMRQTKAMARELHVVGLMNVQYAIRNEEIYVLEVNPRASRTIPFVSKAIGVPLAKIATKVMIGKTLEELGFTEPVRPGHISVKESVFPFNRFPNADLILGPEMKSTGEVMGIDASFGIAFAKSQMAAGFDLPLKGNVFISVHDQHKERMLPIAKTLRDMGFCILATGRTAAHLRKNGVDCQTIKKVSEGRPHVVDYIKNGDIQIVINTGVGRRSSLDGYHIRRGALTYNIPYTTTIAGARAVTEAIAALQKAPWGVRPLQEYYKRQ